VNRSADDVALVPPAVLTVTSTLPLPEGTLAAIVVELTRVTPDAFLVPKETVAGPLNPVPVIVTHVPAALWAGDIAVMLGGGT
jgi:hypothetical protein